MTPDDADFPVFNDGKAPEALRTIGEVANALGIRQHVLRYWEEQFPTLNPVKRSGGRRYYRLEDIVLLRRIDRMVHRDGLTLRGARLAIAAEGSKRIAAAQAAPPIEHVSPKDLAVALTRIRNALADALAAS
jgi:DNA-binding transcriptional MerR regulator